MSNHQQKILGDIVKERIKQDAKWGDQHHTIYKWLAILGEEIGEANKAALEYDVVVETVAKNYFPMDELFASTKWVELRDELIQSAAVIVQILEHMDSEGIEI